MLPGCLRALARCRHRFLCAQQGGNSRLARLTSSQSAGDSRAVDFVVVGAGIIGVNVATVLKQRQPHAKIVIVDKEEAAGQHASGRNSGVLHAGFYYTKDSLKAQLTQSGNQYLTWYCKHNSLPLDNCGKLVVAKDAKELPGLNSLYERGQMECRLSSSPPAKRVLSNRERKHTN